jgi:hypothetical protein
MMMPGVKGEEPLDRIQRQRKSVEHAFQRASVLIFMA